MAKAIGVYAFVASAGGAVGLLAGGILTQAINWHWIFFVNLPVGAVTAIARHPGDPADQGTGLRAGADMAGALLITGAMMLGVFTIVKPAAEDGWLAGQDPLVRRRLDRPAGRLHRPSADREEPADAAARPASATSPGPT